MSAVLGYMKSGYITLMILAALLVIMYANRSAKIEGTRKICIVAALAFLTSVCEYIEEWLFCGIFVALFW